MKYIISTAYLSLLMALYQLQKNKDDAHIWKQGGLMAEILVSCG
jgi:hypothetical protein